MGSDVQPRYMKLSDGDRTETILGLYIVSVLSGGITADNPPYILAKPDTATALDYFTGAGPYRPLTVLNAETVTARDRFGNFVANQEIHFSKDSGPSGNPGHGFISLTNMASYTSTHPWPTTDQISTPQYPYLKDDILEFTDAQGRATAYPALGDALNATYVFYLVPAFDASHPKSSDVVDGAWLERGGDSN